MSPHWQLNRCWLAAAPAWDSPTFEVDMDTYYVTMIDRLNTESPDTFTPSINCLDKFLRSLNIGE